jgi:protein involved in polysaccharide export with SLBB domain
MIQAGQPQLIKKPREFFMKKPTCLSITATLVFMLVLALDAFAQQAPSVAQDYRIGNGDVLEIVTWKEPDFPEPRFWSAWTAKYHFLCLTIFRQRAKLLPN